MRIGKDWGMTEPWRLSWSDWLISKPPDQRADAERMLAVLQRLGAPDAEGWVRSEIDENIAQLARFVVLGEVADVIARWQYAETNAHEEDQALRAGAALFDTEFSPSVTTEILGTGVDPELVGRFAMHVAAGTAFDVLHAIDEQRPSDELGDDLPGWILMETTPTGELTGRDVGGLHESLAELTERP